MVEIKQRFLTGNACYKAGRKITPKGIMVHSTGANNPKLSRYIQPDDGLLGVNPNKNDWNRSDVNVCVHAFIGKDKNGDVRVYQTLPWNHRGWHGGGSSNNTHISFEICEDGLNDGNYFKQVYEKSVELCAYLAKKYNIPVDKIICHSEGYKMGIASNHSDVMHWFPKHGKSMDTFREDVKNKLSGVKSASIQEEDEEMFVPSNGALKEAVSVLLLRLSDKNVHGENAIDPSWRDKFNAGELSISDGLALIYTAMYRGTWDREKISGR